MINSTWGRMRSKIPEKASLFQLVDKKSDLVNRISTLISEIVLSTNSANYTCGSDTLFIPSSVFKVVLCNPLDHALQAFGIYGLNSFGRYTGIDAIGFQDALLQNY